MDWRDPLKFGGKYSRWHDALIKKAQKRGPLPRGDREIHHTDPKSFGGSDGPTVHLTFREHFVVHLLLIELAKPEFKDKMRHAIWRMANKGSGRLSSWEYERARRENIEATRRLWTEEEFRTRFKVAMSGDNNPMRRPELSGDNHANKRPEVRAKISASHKALGENHHLRQPERRALQREIATLQWQDPEFRAKMSASRKVGQRIRREREAAEGTNKRPDMLGAGNPMSNPDIAARQHVKISGENSPTKREDVRAKMRAAWVKRKAKRTEGNDVEVHSANLLQR